MTRNSKSKKWSNVLLQQGTRNWYRREENNGWRPITIKALSSAESDPVTVATSKASPMGSGDRDYSSPGSTSHGNAFHFSRLVRKEFRAARLKRRVREMVT